MTRTFPPIAMLVMLVATVSNATAQQSLDKPVANDEAGHPIVLTTMDGRTLGAFARAAGVPIGIELAPGATPGPPRPVTLTGMTVDAALGVIAGFDRRYEMRDIDGVFVLRTRDAWNRDTHPLDAPAPAVHLDRIRARNALSLLAALLGAPQYRNTQIGDTTRFALHVDGGSILDVLNATVRAHGRLAWSFTYAGNENGAILPYTLMIYDGRSGEGCGVPGVMPTVPVDVSSYADPVLFAVGGSPAALDRLVGHRPDGSPLVVIGPFPSSVRDLANATRVPMGIEFLGPELPPRTDQVRATGRTLREIMDALVAIDPRYEWREFDGVIVIRPATAWNDSGNPLNTPVPSVQLTNVTATVAVERLASALGRREPLTPFPGGRRVSVDQPSGTALELITAILRAHGEMIWELSPETDADSIRQGYRYTLMLGIIGGGGHGFAIR